MKTSAATRCPRLTDLDSRAILRPGEWLDLWTFICPPELAQLIQEKINSGRYSSASEVVREALRLLKQKDELHAVRLRQLRSRIDKGLAEAGRSEGVDGDTFMQGLIEDLDNRDAKRNAG